MKRIILAIAADHAGLQLKHFLTQQKNIGAYSVDWKDFGPSDSSSVDYPDFAQKACEAVQKGQCEKAVLVCGSGIGMSIAANKMQGIRAAHVESTYTAQLAAEHNQANVLCLGERITAAPYALAMVEAWLNAEFGGKGADAGVKSRHERRIQKIHGLEKGKA